MYHKLVLVGNLGADPEMRYLPNGTAVTNFSVATNRRWNDQDGNPVEETTWFRISVFGKQAEACNEYLSKGRQVLVDGRMKPDDSTGGPRLWTGQDGTVHASYEVTANTVRFLQGGGEPAGQQASKPAGKPAGAEDDEIPF